jgi:hypothetical protein
MSDINTKAEAAAREIHMALLDDDGHGVPMPECFAAIITRHFAPLVEAGDHLTAIIGGNFNALDDYDEAHAALAAWTAAKGGEG